MAPAWYRVCGTFDFQADVEEFDMECTGLEGKAGCPLSRIGAHWARQSNSPQAAWWW